MAQLPGSRHRLWVRSHLERWRLRRRERRRVLESEPSPSVGVAIVFISRPGLGGPSVASTAPRPELQLTVHWMEADRECNFAVVERPSGERTFVCTETGSGAM